MINFLKPILLTIFITLTTIYVGLFVSITEYMGSLVALLTLSYCIGFFFFYILLSQNLIFKSNKEIKFSRAELFIIGVLLSYVLGAFISSLMGFRDPSVLAYGHLGDFFQLIYLANINDYTSVTNGGYLPGIVVLSKLISYLFYFTENMLEIEWNIILYGIITFAVLIISTFPFLKNVSIFKKIIIISLLSISMPFFLNMERGNWVLLSLLFLSLILLSSSKYRSIFLVIFASLKIMNLPFAAIFVLSKSMPIKKLIITSVPIFVIFGLIIIVFGTRVDYSLLISSVSSATGFFPDGHIATAHSGLYASLVYYDLNFVSTAFNRFDYVNYFLMIMKILLIFFFIILIYYRYKSNIEMNNKEIPILSFIAIFFTMKLFHPHNTDMNLILLIPVFCILLSEENVKSYLVPSALISILFFDLTFYSLFEVELIDHVQRHSMHYFTLKTFIYPIIYLGLIISSFYEITKKLKGYHIK